jgi:hypothetical protein
MTVVEPTSDGCLEIDAFRSATEEALVENFPEWEEYINRVTEID